MDGFKVIDKAADDKVLLQMLNRLVPDIILLDINMPYLVGIEACHRILATRPETKIVFISMFYNRQIIDQVKQSGAHGFIMKDITAPVLKESLMAISSGEPVFLLPAGRQGYEILSGENYLLNKYKPILREQDVIRLIQAGRSNKQIASIMDLGIYTVETHRKNINRKLNVHNTAELIAFINQI